MSNDPQGEQPVASPDDLLPEYHFDYGKARPNRFAASCPPGGRLVIIEPEIAQVFPTDEAVNSALRALIAAKSPTTAR